MGVLSWYLNRRASRSAAPADGWEAGPAGETDVLTGLGTLVAQVHQFQQSPVAAGDASAMMAKAEGLQTEIREIVARHGFDGTSAMTGSDIADATEMQREIMEAMARHGFGAGAIPGAPSAQPQADPPAESGPIRDPLSGR